MKHTRSIISDHLVKSGKNSSPENIRSFIDKNRKKIKNLIKEYKEINWENFEILDFITFVREKFELPSQIPLDAFIKLITYSVTTWNTLDYDWLLKLIPQDTRKSDNLKIVKKEKLIKNQWEHLAQWLVEIIANACDASNPEVQVGRFWEGFFQSLRFLQEFENAKLSINTKKQWEKAFEISLVEEKNEVKVWSLTSKKQENWTIVSLAAKLDDKTLTYLNDFICSRFGTNPYINLYLNWKRLNDLEEFVYINWQKLDTSLLPVVNITLNENWFIAEDFWVGMDSKTICEKLLIPTSSSKLRTKMDIEETKKYADKHTRFFYKRNTKPDKKQKTTIRLQVAGVVNEEFESETSSNISIFSLETPFFEWVPEAKNQVLPTRWVVLTIEKAISKIFDKCETLEEKVELSEIVWKIISKLKERKTNETEKKYTLDYIWKEAFKPFLEELKELEKIVLPADAELQKIIWANEKVIFVSPDFINFDITSLPGVKKIDSIIGETKPFYAMEFSQDATHDYLIHKTWILVNSKYLNSKTDSDISPIQILNTSINLNIWYEIQSDIVFYGRIDKDNLTLSSPTKKSKSEEFSQTQFNQENTKLSLYKNSEEYREMLEEKRWVLKEVLDEFFDEFEKWLKIFCEIATLKYGVIKRSVSMLLDKDELVLGIKNPKDFMNYAFFWKNIDYKIADNFIARLRQKTPEIQWNILYYISLLTIYSEGLNDNNLPRDLNINQEIKDAILNKIELDKYIELIDKIFELFEAEPEFMSQVARRLSSENGKWYRNKMIFEIQKIISDLEQIKETWEFPNQNTTKIEIDDTEYTEIEDIMDPKFAFFMEDEDIRRILLWDVNDQDNWGITEERILDKFQLNKNTDLRYLLTEKFEIEDEDLSIETKERLFQMMKRTFNLGNWRFDLFIKRIKGNDVVLENLVNKYTNLFMWHFHTQHIIYQLKKNWFVKKEVEVEKTKEINNTEYTGIEDIMDPKFAFFMEDEDVKNLYNVTHWMAWRNETNEIRKKYKFDWKINLGIFDWVEYDKAKYCLERLNGKAGTLLLANGKNLYECLEEYFKSDDKNKEYIDFCNKYNIEWRKIHWLYELFNIQNIIYQLKKNWFVKKEVEEENKIKVWENETIFEPLYEDFYKDLKKCLNNHDREEIYYETIESLKNIYWIAPSDRSLSEFYYEFLLNKKLMIIIFSWEIKKIDLNSSWRNIQSELKKNYQISLNGYYIDKLADFLKFITPTPELKKRCLKLQQEKKASEDFQAESLSDPKYAEFMKDMKAVRATKNFDWIHNLWSVFEINLSHKYPFLEKGMINWIMDYLSLLGMDSITDKNIIKIIRNFTDEKLFSLKWDNHSMLHRHFNEKYPSYRVNWNQLLEQVVIYLLEKNLFNKPKAESLSDPKYAEFMKDMKEFWWECWGKDILNYFKISPLSSKYPFLWNIALILLVNSSYDLRKNPITDINIIKGIRKFIDEFEPLIQEEQINSKRIYDTYRNYIFWQIYPNHNYIPDKYQFFEQVVIYLLEKNLSNKSTLEEVSIIAQIDKTIDELRAKLREYPQDLVAFGEFLDKGWEFLKSEISVIKIEWDKKFKLSELIAGYRLHNKELMDIEDEQHLENFTQNILSKNYNCELFQNEIRSSIDGQDESAMIWVRELVQNSRDVILGSGNSWKIEINFYEEDGNWVSSVRDPIWMNLKQVFNYLLVPGESSKTGANSEGMFGQGFYSTAIESKEIRVKTGVWDWKTTVLVFKPIFNEWWLIHDFEISYEVINEDFKWTLVERVDKASWIWGNLRALIGVHNIQKYVWNVDDVEILYKWESIVNTKELLETVAVPGYWEIKIFETSDKIERKTKNNLYIRDLPDDYLDDLPDWMSKFIKSRNISIEVPAWMELTKTRNSLAQREKNLPILKPYLFKGFVGMLLKSFVDRNTWVKIPMLPEDYLSLEDKHLNYSRQINRIADKYNSWQALNDDEIEILKNDSERMAQFLIQANFEYEWKITNLREMKQKILAKNRIQSNSSIFNEMQDQSFFTSDSINRWMENVERNYNIKPEKISEKLWVSVEQIKNFNNFMENNFSELTGNLYWWKFINSYYERDWWENSAAKYKKIGWNIYMYWNIDHIGNWIKNFWDPETQEKIIEITTHEIVHLLENKDKLWSHEKNLEHDKSFELIQRNLLTTMQRI